MPPTPAQLHDVYDGKFTAEFPSPGTAKAFFDLVTSGGWEMTNQKLDGTTVTWEAAEESYHWEGPIPSNDRRRAIYSSWLNWQETVGFFGTSSDWSEIATLNGADCPPDL